MLSTAPSDPTQNKDSSRYCSQLLLALYQPGTDPGHFSQFPLVLCRPETALDTGHNSWPYTDQGQAEDAVHSSYQPCTTQGHAWNSITTSIGSTPIRAQPKTQLTGPTGPVSIGGQARMWLAALTALHQTVLSPGHCAHS